MTSAFTPNKFNYLGLICWQPLWAGWWRRSLLPPVSWSCGFRQRNGAAMRHLSVHISTGCYGKIYVHYIFLIYRNIREMRISLQRQLPIVKHGKRMACEPIHHPGIPKNKKKLRFVRHLTIDQAVSLWTSHQAVKCPPYLPPLHSFLSSFLCPMMPVKNPRSPGTEIESEGREGHVPASNAPINKLLWLLLLGHIPSG